jgi:ketosteroid isomerase-like protein
MSLGRVVAAAVLSLTLVGCGGGGGAATAEFGKEDAEALRKLLQDYTGAYNAKDSAKTIAFFAGNATLMPPNSSTVRGSDSIKGYFDSRFSEGTRNMTLDIRDFGGVGNLSFLSGNYEVRFTPASGGDEQRDRGKYLGTARKLANRWLFESLIWNSDLPIPEPPAPPPADGKK